MTDFTNAQVYDLLLKLDMGAEERHKELLTAIHDQDRRLEDITQRLTSVVPSLKIGAG